MLCFKKYLLEINYIDQIENGFDRAQAASGRKDAGIGEDIDLNTLSEKEQIRIVKVHPINIKYIDNPSEQVQLACVNQSYSSINHIENPTENVQKLAASLNAWITLDPDLSGIENPSDEVVKIGLDQNPNAIWKIENPTLKHLIFAYNSQMEKGDIRERPNTSSFDEDFPWERKDFQKWLVDKDRSKILRIPRDKLDPELAEKYKYFLSMNKAGIFK